MCVCVRVHVHVCMCLCVHTHACVLVGMCVYRLDIHDVRNLYWYDLLQQIDIAQGTKFVCHIILYICDPICENLA